MPWVENNEKVRARTDLHFSLRNDMTVLRDLEKKTEGAIQLLRDGLMGFPSGIDQNPRGILDRTTRYIKDAQRTIGLALEQIDKLDVTEWISDEF